MRLAFSIIIIVISVAILGRAWFSEIRPFDILRQSLLRLPAFVRSRWRLSLTILLACLLLPFGSLVASGLIRPPVLRTGAGLIWQGLFTALLALIAIRIHRGLIKREIIDGLRFGPRERRMAAYVVGVWLAMTILKLIPIAALEAGAPFAVARILEALATPLTILLTAALVLVGPAASLDDPTPLRTALASFRAQPFAILAIVLLTQLMWGLGGLALAVVATGVGLDSPLQLVTIGLSIALIAAVFIVSEQALAMALTRVWVNVYDEDTLGRDYNADWH
jgi:hypothetical protein